MEEPSSSSTPDPEADPIIRPSNVDRKLLKRLETVPDIKRDTSGINTQYIATGIVNLGALAAGICVSSSSAALRLLRNEQQPDYTANGTANFTASGHSKLEITDSVGSWVASLLCLGALWGAVPSGLVSEYFGRKKTLLYLALPMVVSWILIGSSTSIYGLYVGRFVAGVAVGAFSVAIQPYVADIAENHMQSTLAKFYHVHFSAGILFGYIFGLAPSIGWLSFLSAVVPVAFFIAFLFLPESPTYLMTQGKYHEAKAALRYYRGIDNDVDKELKDLKENIRNYARNKVTFKQLFNTKGTVKALVVSFGLMVFQQMSGIYPILFYAEKIFRKFAISMTPYGATIVMAFCLVSSTYFSTMLIGKLRRRLLLMSSFGMMALSTGSLAIYYHSQIASRSMKDANDTWFPLFTLCIFVIVFACGVGPIPWLMLREIFPSNVTRRATAITAGFHWFIAFGVSKLYQNMVDMVMPGWTLWNFAVASVIGALFVYFFVPETKDRTLEEIQNEFNGIRSKKMHRHVIAVESVIES